MRKYLFALVAYIAGHRAFLARAAPAVFRSGHRGLEYRPPVELHGCARDRARARSAAVRRATMKNPIFRAPAATASGAFCEQVQRVLHSSRNQRDRPILQDGVSEPHVQESNCLAIYASVLPPARRSLPRCIAESIELARGLTLEDMTNQGRQHVQRHSEQSIR